MTGTISKPDSRSPQRLFEGGPLSSLRHEMEDMFQHFFGTPTTSRFTEVAIPSIDVSETDEAIEVKTDLPGITAEDVEIEVRENVLTISGQTSKERTTEEGNGRRYHRIERTSGQFSRSVRLPCAVDQESIDAELKDGVLTVTMPKAADVRSRRVAVRKAK